MFDTSPPCPFARLLAAVAASLLLGAVGGCAAEDQEGVGGSSDKADEGASSLPLIIGHRGAPRAEAENTLPSFERALIEGANALEIDLCLTADERVAVWHDRTPGDLVALVRQAGLEGLRYVPYNPNIGNEFRRPVDELTLDELRTHYGYALRESAIVDVLFPGVRDEDAHIPSLEEFAFWTEGQPKLESVMLDIKLADDQVELAQTMARNIADITAYASFEIIVMSPHEDIILEMRSWFRSNAPDHPVGFVLDFESQGALAATKRLELDAISTGKTVLRGWDGYLEEMQDIVSERDAGESHFTQVIGWTIDDEAQMKQLIDIGIDGIMTNRPADLARLSQRGWRDHKTVGDVVSECWRKHKDSVEPKFCALASDLGLFAPITEDQISDWACDDDTASARTKGVFGCGINDNQEVSFETTLSIGTDTAIWFRPAFLLNASSVVVTPTAEMPIDSFPQST